MRGAAITAWGTELPGTVVTNEDLTSTLDTSDAWITERTGIRERRLVARGGPAPSGLRDTTSALAVGAGRRALDMAGLSGQDIDLLVLATATPDQMLPATSSVVQHELGLHCGAFDLNAVCSGFVYAMVAANGLVTTGLDRVLVIGAETVSRIIDWSDRGTAILFADGAGAMVLEAVPGEGHLLGWDLGADGSARGLLYADHGGFVKMDGKEVFRRAVRVTVESSSAAMERAKVTPDEIALFVPHQANIRIIEAVLCRLGIDMEHTAITLDRTGNTSAASIPVALAEAADAGRLSDGDLVLVSGFGAGMTWASAVWRWGR
jgi:3-oxoacyl-[acyl-carrier-protein] synthase-3